MKEEGFTKIWVYGYEDDAIYVHGHVTDLDEKVELLGFGSYKEFRKQYSGSIRSEWNPR